MFPPYVSTNRNFQLAQSTAKTWIPQSEYPGQTRLVSQTSKNLKTAVTVDCSDDLSPVLSSTQILFRHQIETNDI